MVVRISRAMLRVDSGVDDQRCTGGLLVCVALRSSTGGGLAGVLTCRER